MANKYKGIAEESAKSVLDEKLKISFEYLDWECDEFFFHGMETIYYKKVFNCITEIKKCKESDIVKQKHPSLSPKSIFNTTSSIKDSFSENIISKVSEKLFVESRDREIANSQALEITSRAFELSISRNYGRLHGFLWNNIFNIVWFDPAHNLYPMKKGVTKHKNAASVRCFSPDEVLRLQSIIKKLKVENQELYEAFSKT